MVDERTTNQAYTTNLAANPDVVFTLAGLTEVGAVMIHGGSGAQSERLIDFEVEYWTGSARADLVAPIVGNTQKTTYHLASYPVFTTQIRLHITQADNSVNDNFARIAEAFIFQAIPEPGAFMGALALGGLVLRRKQ